MNDREIDSQDSGSPTAGVDPRRVWLGVAAQVWRREPGPAERLAAHVLRSPGLARALVITPNLLLGWLVATLTVVTAGIWATAATGTPFVALVAPPLAASGIAFAYGPGIDPAWELSRSMAVNDRMVLIVRGLAVFAINALIGVVATLLTTLARQHTASPGAQTVSAVTYGWLLPMTAVCLLSLAVACLTGSSNAGLTAGLGAWALTVSCGRVIGGSFATAVTDTSLTLPYLLVALLCGAVAAYALRGLKGIR